jgi:hypothetical protein
LAAPTKGLKEQDIIALRSEEETTFAHICKKIELTSD